MSHRPARYLLGALSSLSVALFLSPSKAQQPDLLAIPLDFEINGQPSGEILIESDSAMSSVFLNPRALQAKLAENGIEDLDFILAELPDGFMALEELRGRGLNIALDLERLVITLIADVSRPVAEARRQSIRLGFIDPVQRSHRHAEEAGFSAYVNVHARLSRREDAFGNPVDSRNLYIEHVFNFNGIAIEGDSVWNVSSETRESAFRMNRIRMVKDFPNRLQRLAIGDISTPIKNPQRGFQLWGASLFQEFDLQPYRTFTPTSSASFELDENATVEMRLNSRRGRRLKLAPGIYDIEQFKLAAGLNTMDLEIVTESGAVERISVDSYGDSTLLDKGLSTHALSFGLPIRSEREADTFTLSGASWYTRYLGENPVISGYYQRGLTDRLTANVNGQANVGWSRLGMETTWASRFGIFNFNLGLNSVAGQSSSASSRIGFDWKLNTRDYQLAVSGYAADAEFQMTRSDSDVASRAIRESVSLRIGRRFGERFSADAGILRQLGFAKTPEQSIAANLGYKFNRFHSALSLRYSNRESDNGLSAFLTLTWSPGGAWRARSRAGLASGGAGGEASTNIDYSSRRLNSYVNANLNLRRTRLGKGIDGRLRYETYKFAAALSRSHLYQNINDVINQGVETAVSGEFAIAFADGSFGLTRRITDGFAIVANHEAWRDVELGINPTLGGYEQRARRGLLNPVITDLQAYRETQAIIRPLDGDAFLETDRFHFLPSYRRGSKLVIGDEFVYSLRSSLAYWNEQPAVYKTLKITGEDVPDLLAFTNGSGKFVVTGLKPGNYRIHVRGSEETAGFSIHGKDKLVFIDRILLSDPKER